MSVQRRSYGSGSLSARTDNRGREAWYDRWYIDGQRVQRKIGVKRTPGGRDGLTKAAAEAELRRQIATAHTDTPSRGPRDGR